MQALSEVMQRHAREKAGVAVVLRRTARHIEQGNDLLCANTNLEAARRASERTPWRNGTNAIASPSLSRLLGVQGAYNRGIPSGDQFRELLGSRLERAS